jgi:hypothetical protein
MLWNVVRTIIAAGIIVAVAEIAERFPRLGALLLTLPIVSVLAFVMAWTQHGQLTVISRLARETLVLVPLGLPFFVPLAFAEKLGLGFWTACFAGIALAAATIGAWFAFGPQRL